MSAPDQSESVAEQRLMVITEINGAVGKHDTVLQGAAFLFRF